MTHFFDNADLEQLFRNIYNSDLELYVFSKDLEGKFTFVNNKLLSRLGMYNESEILGRTDYDFFDKKLADEYRSEDRKVTQSGHAILNEIWHVPNGRAGIDWYISSKYPIFDKGKNVIGLLGIMRGSIEAASTLNIYDEMSKVIEYIQDHYETKIESEKLAKIVHLSNSQFSRRFKSIFKMSPSQYIIKVRVDAACQKLIQSHDPITTIALDCGFYDNSYFTKKFKLLMGMTPKQYRVTYYQN